MKFRIQILGINIGDLWKTVQQKYVISDLKGLSIDEETGLPSQLAERKQRLTNAGHEDALTEARLELEEADRRRTAMERSETPTKKKATTKAPAKGKTKPKSKTKTKTKAKSKTKTKAKAKTKKKEETAFLEVESIEKIVVSGMLTVGTEDPIQKSIVFDPKHLSYRQWSKIALEIEKDDLVQLTLSDEEDGTYATSLKI
ncbi:MAG: hypothetical protein ACXAD7_01000 [Candidatus Kariarchaeaceae archaeon]|jgi:hypothetical protein